MISSEQQLCSAAERLGAEVQDLRRLFPSCMRTSGTSNRRGFDSLNTGGTSLFHSEAIHKALDESLFAICERAFGNSSSQGSAFSPGYSTPPSPRLLNPIQHADNNSATSASSSAAAAAAAAQIQSIPKAKSTNLAVSCETALSSADESAPGALREAMVLREVAKTDLDKRSDMHGNGKESTAQEKSPFHPLSNNRSHSPPKTPIGCILSFARGERFSLVHVSDIDEQNALRKMHSLSIIPGCDMYSECCLFSYIGALLKAHLNLVQSVPKNQADLTTVKVDDLTSEIPDTLWRTIFLGTVQATPISEGFAEDCPPMVRKSIDLVQFTYRLLDKMSGASDSLSRGFLEGLYSSGTPKLVASLTAELLSSWANVWRKVASFQQESLLLEWCIRLLTDFVVYELSPVSQARHMKSVSPNAFVVFNLGKQGLPSLSTLVDYCFQFVSSHQVGKECRLALCELGQAYLIWSAGLSHEGSAQAKHWKGTQEARQEYLDSLVAKEGFWTIVVQSALQHVKKLPQLSDSCFEYTFLSSLVSVSAAKRALFDGKQDKSKRMLVNVMIRILELMNRDLLSCFLEAEGFRKMFPGIQTSIDFVHGLIASAAVQREILSADPTTKGRFLSSLELLISNSAKIVPCAINLSEAMEYAQKGPFAKGASTELDRCEEGSECGDSRTETKKGKEHMKRADQILAREKAVAFAAKLIGCLGKSVEDGSWDMSQMNSIKALFHARINSSRTRHRLWNDIYKIQKGVEKRIGTELLLSTLEQNSFAMVVEVVRKYTSCDSTDRDTGAPAQEDSDGSQAIVTTSATRDIKACFPPVWEVSELQHSVCSADGYTDFENNHDMLMFMKDVLTDIGQQMLARYDPDSPFTVKWIRLQKRNAYIGRARELLDKSDRTVGQLCSCVPGYPKENGNGSKNRVACSNDLCENRHMKIECAPGKCGAGGYCMNQRMQNLDYAKFKMVPFPGKGVGIVADEDIPEGALVGEYQGEVVTMGEYKRRVQEYEGERHFYFMTLTNKLVIDASRKSQATRFLNHSCDPNAETQKWNADGEPRVGIFAKRAISKGEEITFDYGARSLTQSSAQCLCGAKNCRGLLTVRKEETCTSQDLPQESPTINDTRSEGMQERRAKCPRRKRERFIEEDRRSNVVRERIETAKMYLHQAELLSKKAAENPPFPRDHPSDDEMQRKLKLWKASLSRGAGVAAISEKGFEGLREEARFPRIPRRSALPTPNDKSGTEKSHYESTEKNSSSRRISVSREADVLPVVQNARSSMANRRGPSAGRWALFEETCAGKVGDSQTPLKRQGEVDSVRRLSKVPRAGFLPTTSKLKKQPLRPKFAKRQRTRKQDENDSMDDYSTASEAEPVLEEPITSPSRLPDGNGACSDDEFIAAPPVESIRFSPTSRRWNPSDHERRAYDERQMSRGGLGRAGERTRDGRRSRLGCSYQLAWNKSDPNQQSHARSVHGVHSPRTYEQFRPMRADPQDVVGRGKDPFGPMIERRRYTGYRREWSPSKERYRQPHPKKVEHKLEVEASEEIDDCNHHSSRRVLGTGRALGRTLEDTAYLTFRQGYNEGAEASALSSAKERRQPGDVSPARRSDQGQEWSRMATEDTDKPLSTKHGGVNVHFRACTRMDRSRGVSRRKQGMGRSLLDKDRPSLDQPYHERSEPIRLPRVVASHSVDSSEGRPLGDHSFTYRAEKEMHREPFRRGEGRYRVDLRNFLNGRPKNKNL